MRGNRVLLGHVQPVPVHSLDPEFDNRVQRLDLGDSIDPKTLREKRGGMTWPSFLIIPNTIADDRTCCEWLWRPQWAWN